MFNAEAHHLHYFAYFPKQKSGSWIKPGSKFSWYKSWRFLQKVFLYLLISLPVEGKKHVLMNKMFKIETW